MFALRLRGGIFYDEKDALSVVGFLRSSSNIDLDVPLTSRKLDVSLTKLSESGMPASFLPRVPLGQKVVFRTATKAQSLHQPSGSGPAPQRHIQTVAFPPKDIKWGGSHLRLPASRACCRAAPMLPGRAETMFTKMRSDAPNPLKPILPDEGAIGKCICPCSRMVSLLNP